MLKKENMTIEEIIKVESDSELLRYGILSILKNYQTSFRRNKLYPALTELVNTAVRLENLANKSLKTNSAKEASSPFEEEVIFADLETEEEDETSLFARWAISQISPVIDEGIAIFEFVEKYINLKQVNGFPYNKEEGYLAVPDVKSCMYNIYKFDSILFRTNNIPVHSIKSKFILSVPEENLNPSNGKIDINKLMDYIGNSKASVYICETELDFPFEDTILPVAKKSLLKLLSD